MFKKIFLSVLVIFVFLFQMACPVKKTDLEKMRNYSGAVASGANAGIELTRALYRENFLSLAQKDAIADGFINLAQGGKFVDVQIEKAIAEYDTGNVPKDVRARVVALFRSDILDRFLDLVEKLKLVDAGDRYRQILQSVKTAVIALSLYLGIGNQTKAALKEVAV